MAKKKEKDVNEDVEEKPIYVTHLLGIGDQFTFTNNLEEILNDLQSQGYEYVDMQEVFGHKLLIVRLEE